MAYLLNLIEEGARPPVLTRRIDLEGRSEALLRIYIDVRPDEARAGGLRRSLLLPNDQIPSSEGHLVLLGTLRCRMELGAFQVIFQPVRITGDQIAPGPATMAPSTPASYVPSTPAPYAPSPYAPAPFAPAPFSPAPPGPGPFPPARSGPLPETSRARAPFPVSPLDFDGGDVDLSIEPDSVPPTPAPRPAASTAAPPRLPSYHMGVLTPEGSIRPMNVEERPDPGTRYRIVREVRPDGTLVTLPRPLTLELAWSDEESQELGRVRRGAGMGVIQGSGATPNSWIVPPIEHFFASPFAGAITKLRKLGERVGISPAVLVGALSIIGTVVGAGVFTVRASQLSEAAEAEALEAVKAKEKAMAAAGEALNREQTCRQDMAQIVQASGNLKDARRQEGEAVLGASLAEVELRKLRGRPDPLVVGNEDARRQRLDRLMALLLERKETRAKEVVPRRAHRLRLQFSQLFAPDLSPWMLLWHSNPRSVEVARLRLEGNGVDYRGAWGISSRVRREFSRPEDELLAAAGSSRERSTGGSGGDGGAPAQQSGGLEDVRDRDEWSAATVAEGFRRIRQALLTADLGGREPVYPEQLHLWTFALWHAYNHMPDLQFGRSVDVRRCVSNLMTDLAISEQDDEARNQPVLPDLAAVLQAQAWIGGPLNASALCPWREDRMLEATKYALEAVTDAWLLQEDGEE